TLKDECARCRVYCLDMGRITLRSSRVVFNGNCLKIGATDAHYHYLSDWLNQSNKLVVALIAICAAIWIIAAINPLDRQAWVLENILLVVFVGGLALT